MLFADCSMPGGVPRDSDAALALVSTIQPLIGDKPWWLTLGWADVENSSRMGCDRSQASLGGECGFCQLSADERALVGVTQDCVTNDANCSLEACFSLMEAYGSRLQAAGVQYGTDTYWLLVKLAHGAGWSGVSILLNRASADGVNINDWDALTSYALANDADLSRAVGHGSGYFAHWINNANCVQSSGNILAAAAGVAGSAAAGSFLPYVVGAAALTAIGVSGYVFWKRRRRT